MRTRTAALAAALLAASSVARGGGTEGCERLLARGDEEKAASCYLNAWRGGAPAAPIVSRLSELVSAGGAGGWLLQTLGTLQAATGDKEAESTFGNAVDSFVRGGDRYGEAIALASKATYYSRSRRFGESEAELRKADLAAAASGSPVAIARVRIAEALLCLRREDPLGGLERLVAGEAAAKASRDDDLLAEFFGTRASLLWASGRSAESLESYRLQIASLERLGDSGRIAGVLANMAIVERNNERKRDFAREALERAGRSGNLSAEVSARFTLAEIEEGREGLAQALGALKAARKLGDEGMLRMALRAAGYRLVESGDREGVALLKEAVASAARSGDPAEEARCRFVLSRALWQAGPRGEAMRESIASLDAAEATRRGPASLMSRTVRFAQWGNLYYRAAGYILSGELLPAGAEIPREDVSRAFRIAERVKARRLLDVLDSGAEAGDATAGSPDFVSLETLQEALVPEEALFSFLINAERSESGRAFNGGSWVFVVSRGGVKVVRLRTDRRLLQDQTRLLTGLIAGRTGGEADGAAALHATLFAEALASLPPGIRRLLVVPDDALHGFPVGLLRPRPNGEPLAATYEIVSVPSATVWYRLRRRSSNGRAILSFSDPDLPGEAVLVAAPAADRAGLLGPLPYARREGHNLVRRAGGASRLLAGPEATEGALKKLPLAPIGLLHIGAHALVEHENPERSAIVLAPGDGDDGLLRVEEIRRLPLSGQFVALSACGSASGTYYTGEGLLSLTTAFLVAGSRAVLGTLWPVRDDEAEEFSTAFYSELGRGRTASAALASAQRALLGRNRPAASWAAFVLVGDGSITPLGTLPRPGVAPLVLLGAAGALAALVLLRSRRSRPPANPR